MKKVIAIKDINGNNLPIDKMEIIFVGKNFVTAKYKGFGIVKTYGAFDGYEILFKNN